MTLHRLPDGSVHVSHLDEWHLQMLRSIPSIANTGEDDPARRRLFPSPFASGDATEEHFRDWDEFVRPGLEKLFSDSLHRVAKDLERVVPEPPDVPQSPEESLKTPAPPRRRRRKTRDGPGILPSGPNLWGLQIPTDHVEDWYRAMNQVRLVLSEKYDAHRTDNAHITGMFISGRMETQIQYELFTALCSWWVDYILRP